MLLAKKAPVVPVWRPGFRKELEHLYARRSSIDALIESLERYARCKAKHCQEQVPKTVLRESLP